jgi:hypothetical protein
MSPLFGITAKSVNIPFAPPMIASSNEYVWLSHQLTNVAERIDLSNDVTLSAE